MPGKTNKVSFAISLARGPKSERPVTNCAFLKSYAEHGAWLRVLLAANHFRVLADPAASEFTKIAHGAGFYTQAALLYEDTVSMLAALMACASHNDLLLANALSRVVLRRDDKASASTSTAGHTSVSALGTGTKRVFIDPVTFLAHLTTHPGKQLLAALGAQWPETPATSNDEKARWRMLPATTSEVVRLLSDSTSGLLTAYYNKVKHGPQAIVADVQRVALEERGHPEASRGRLPPGRHIRVLLDGARMQEAQGELERGGRVAPFLLHDPYHVDVMLHEVLLMIACGMHGMTTYLLRHAFNTDIGDPDPAVEAIVAYAQKRQVTLPPGAG